MSILSQNDFVSQLNATIIGTISPNTINRVLTRTAANRLNIMSSQQTNSVNAEEEVIRRRGRKQKRKLTDTPVRHSPRITIKIMRMSSNDNESDGTVHNDSGNDRALETEAEADSQVSSDQTHGYNLRSTPKKNESPDNRL